MRELKWGEMVLVEVIKAYEAEHTCLFLKIWMVFTLIEEAGKR